MPEQKSVACVTDLQGSLPLDVPHAQQKTAVAGRGWEEVAAFGVVQEAASWGLGLLGVAAGPPGDARGLAEPLKQTDKTRETGEGVKRGVRPWEHRTAALKGRRMTAGGRDQTGPDNADVLGLHARRKKR